MQEDMKKPTKKQTAHTVLRGLKDGYSYRRPYSFEWVGCQGVESLEPIGPGPEFTKVRHTCVITVDDDEKENVGTEEIGDDLLTIIGVGRRWARF